jgi:cyclohexa-1,5-dienecarbonyl-CoA hydratase
MTEPDAIKFSKTEGVARIVFARPKQHNVFNIDMMNQFIQAMENLAADKELKCVVFEAEGKSWCAGLDVGDHRPENADEMIAVFNRSLKLIGEFEIPTIAAVRGACLGGGMEYAIACDVVIAGKRAKFGQPEIKLGFLPPYAAIRLPLLVGPAKAIEVCTSGKIYSADEAQAMGFVSQVAEDDDFEAAVDKFVAEIKANSPLIIRLNKRAVTQHLGMGFYDAMDSVSDLFLNTLLKTEDTLEGIDSFYAKRRPEWKNK